MVTVHDVPPERLVRRVAQELQESGKVEPPAWAAFAKTGVHREKSPENPRWWYERLASVFRKVYVAGPIGTERLAARYGGRRDRGSAPYHPRKGSRSVIRSCLEQLEALGYVRKDDGRGRVVTPSGQSYLDDRAREILEGMAKDQPPLTKYL